MRRWLLSQFVWLPDAVEIAALVVREGDRVRASGRLVRNSQGDWFQPALPVLGPAPKRRVGPVWWSAVRVTGANFDAVSNRFEDEDAVEGWAVVTGTWSAGQLAIEQQGAPPSPTDPWLRGRWVSPPCPPPPQGWPEVTPRGDILLDYDLGGLLETGAAVAVTLFRPSQHQAVLVVAAGDVAAVEARLRPQLGALVCVVPSRWTKAQLDAVRDHLHDHHERWGVYGWGPQNDDDGQAHMAARLVRVLPEIVAWAASLPPDILVLEPWLMPLRAGAASNSY